MNTRQISRAGPPMITRAIAVSSSAVGGETTQYEKVVAIWPKYAGYSRKLTKRCGGSNGPARCPVLHDDAVRYVQVGHSSGSKRILERPGECGNHRIEERNGDGGAKTTQHRAT